jgi:hypothetical protein
VDAVKRTAGGTAERRTLDDLSDARLAGEDEATTPL